MALTILLGLLLIGLFAVTQSGVAMLAIARFGAGFSQIAETNLPALIAASHLSQLSQTLSATAPDIALADTHVRRQAVADQLADRPTALARSVADLEQAATDPEQVANIQRHLNTLVANLKGLDEFVRERIEAKNWSRGSWPACPTSPRARKDFGRSDHWRARQRAAHRLTISATDRTRLVEWSAAGWNALRSC